MAEDWRDNREYDPSDFFQPLRASVENFAVALAGRVDVEAVKTSAKAKIRQAVLLMEDDYEKPEPVSPPTQQSPAKADSLEQLFRDVDE